MGTPYYDVVFVLVAISLSVLGLASDQNPLQDFCVADPTVQVLMNGLPCKDPKAVQADDFSFSGFNQSGNTSNPLGSAITPVAVSEIPGLNTLGISLVRVDYGRGGVNPPHTHPRASEILTVLDGSLEVGFVTSSPENRRITKVLHKGDVFVFPIGLVHYQKNVGPGNAVAIAALSSQNPGVVIIAGAVFGSVPEMDDDVLVRSFQLDKGVVGYLKSKF
ncbi:putative germin-like protein 2-1 [Morus notabilis]|uniref:putative germin-like protein 2-1 n=1 Tax=Morus notabilis TaxID=981085 RepID=UPI000CED368B|nr:putative germin-like protein 2-1 [Morus notabilis]